MKIYGPPTAHVRFSINLTGWGKLHSSAVPATVDLEFVTLNTSVQSQFILAYLDPKKASSRRSSDLYHVLESPWTLSAASTQVKFKSSVGSNLQRINRIRSFGCLYLDRLARHFRRDVEIVRIGGSVDRADQIRLKTRRNEARLVRWKT
jgi:hypothetical protein